MLGPIPPRFPRPGELLAGCVIERELGRGGMGAVLLARDSRDGHRVALKLVLDPEQGVRRERFIREAEALRALDHPGVVRLLRAETQAEIPCLVMEFVEGHDLAHFFDNKELTRDERLDLLEQVARAVHHAHERGVVHRDLKPANVLVTPDGRAKVTDFGLVKQLARETRLTQSGAMVGTPAYLSPEQIRGGGEEIGPGTDVYALGVMLYEALTDQRPFEGAMLVQLLSQIMTADVTPPSQVNQANGPAEDDLVLRAMARDPAQRFPSALALGEAIAAVRRGERSVAWGRLGGAALIGLALAAVGVSAALWLGRRRPLSGAELEAQAKRLRTEVTAFLHESEPLGAHRARLGALRAELDKTLARIEEGTLPPGELGQASQELEVTEALLALADGDLIESRIALDRLSADAGTSAAERALRGGVAAMLSGDPAAAQRDLSAALGRGVKRLDLFAWRAVALARTARRTRQDMERVLTDLAKVEAARALSPAELSAQIRAQAALGQLEEAGAGLKRHPRPPVDLRWDVALAYAERGLARNPKGVRSLLKGLPPQDPPAAARAQLATRVEVEIRNRAKAELQGPVNDGERISISRLCDVWRLLVGPKEPLPGDLKEVLLQSMERRLSVPKGGEPTIAVALMRLAPDDLHVQREVGFFAHRLPYNAQRWSTIPALRRAIELETDPERRFELQATFCSLAGEINSRFEARFDADMCRELLAVSQQILPRVKDKRRVQVLHGRAIALRRLDRPEEARVEVEAALKLDSVDRAVRHTRMLLAWGQGDRDQAYADALFYIQATDEASQRNDRAVAVAWTIARRRKDDANARKVCESFLRLNRDHAGWWVRLAELQLGAGELPAAQRSMREARKYFPKTKAYRERRALVEETLRITGLIHDRGRELAPDVSALVEELERQRLAGVNGLGVIP